MNLKVTDFQYRLLHSVKEEGEGTTYQLSRRLKVDFWTVREACLMLYKKGYLDNFNKVWKVPEPSELTEPSFSLS